MPLMLSPLSLTTAAAALALAAYGAAAADEHGNYTAVEANAGRSLYAQNCAKCHGADLQGVMVPALATAKVRHDYPTPESLYAFIHVAMPANAPGTLTAAQYHDLAAYLLQRNGRLPASKTPTKSKGKKHGK